MAKIKKITAREILGSQGDQALEVSIGLENNFKTKASLSCDFLDFNNKRPDFSKDIDLIEELSKKDFIGVDVGKQKLIDERLTIGAKHLSNEASMLISMVCARASALSGGKELYEQLAKIFKNKAKKFSLPTPILGMFNGGKHADTNLDFEEFSIIPLLGEKFGDKIKAGVSVFKELGSILKESGFDVDAGAEGGYAPDMCSSIQAMEFMVAAISRAGYQAGHEVALGIDIGSAQIYNKNSGRYVFRLDKIGFSNETLVGLYHEWLRMFPVLMIEDGLGSDDWNGWKEMTREIGGDIMLVGDEFFMSDSARLRRGAYERVANIVAIKLNRFRTLHQLANFASVARTNGYGILVSHSYGETCDDFLADLAISLGAEYFKSGSIARGERVAKYNRLLEIEKILLRSR